MDEYGRLQHRFEQLGGWSIEAEARRILAGLGFAEGDAERDIGEFSGGWMMRVALARLLLANPDLLLLDEPSNHLDLASVEWLQGFLAEYAGAVILVSHDRDFINVVANRIAELHRGTLTEYVGDYADFVEQRETRLAELERQARVQGREVARIERFIERFRYKKSKARQAQAKIKYLERMDRVVVPETRTKSIRFRFPQPARSGRTVISLSGIVKRYGDHTVYDGLDLEPRARPEGGAHRSERGGQEHAAEDPGRACSSSRTALVQLGTTCGSRTSPSTRSRRSTREHGAGGAGGGRPAMTSRRAAAAAGRVPVLRGRHPQAGEGPVRRGADPPGAGQDAGRPGQPAVPRRADEPPRHRQPRRARGRADRLRRHAGPDHPRPIPDPDGGQHHRRGRRRAPRSCIPDDFETYAEARGIDIERPGAAEGKATPRGVVAAAPRRESANEATARKRTRGRGPERAASADPRGEGGAGADAWPSWRPPRPSWPISPSGWENRRRTPMRRSFGG